MKIILNDPISTILLVLDINRQYRGAIYALMAHVKGHMAMNHAWLCVGMVHAQYTSARPQWAGLMSGQKLKIPIFRHK